MKFTHQFIATIVLFALVFSSCSKGTTPKPKAYFRIDFPQKIYHLSTANLPYQFEYPDYSKLALDSSILAEPFWVNLVFMKYKAKLHLTYKPVQNNLQELSEDSRELVYKHAIKATAINEKRFINEEKKVFGTIYEIKGNAASPLQFYLTDSANHFLRGSFYISEIPNYDSLQPVIQFIDEDIHHLIETLSWK